MQHRPRISIVMQQRLALIIVLGMVLATRWLDAQTPAKDSNTAKAPSTAKQSIEQDKAALQPLQYLVSEWKGVGQPKRGSNVGAWSEQLAWAWHFTDGHAQLRATFSKGKYFNSWQLAPTEKAQHFQLTAILADGKTSTEWTATIDNAGILTAVPKDAVGADLPTRITIKPVAMNERMVILYERGSDNQFTRLAEVGTTRVGGNFAAGAGGPECIVTGGLGTISVSYQGKTYLVCCTGCKEAFDADPAGIIAEYQAKVAARKKP